MPSSRAISSMTEDEGTVSKECRLVTSQCTATNVSKTTSPTTARSHATSVGKLQRTVEDSPCSLRSRFPQCGQFIKVRRYRGWEWERPMVCSAITGVQKFQGSHTIS